MHAVTWFDGRDWREGAVVADGDRVRLRPDADPRGLPRLDGIITGGFTDHHVHLQLIDTALLCGSVLGRVVDLGGDPSVLADLAAAGVHNSSNPPAPAQITPLLAASPPDSEELCTAKPGARLQIRFAGAFLTPPGGYPSDRAWAPADSWREVADADAAAAAVAEMADAGASCIKVASNSGAGPVFSDDLLRAALAAATAAGLPAVVHAEGLGEAQRAARLGADRLAHAPFTERLDDDEIRTQAASVAWISTLAIHEGATFDRALDNVRRFHAAGGVVHYGTDMGNGPTPVGINPAEIAALRAAGLSDADLLRALAPVDPLDPDALLLFFPGSSPTTADPLHARPLTPADLKV